MAAIKGMNSYSIGISIWTAIIPTKCIDQIPNPIISEPPISQILLFKPVLMVTFLESSREIYEAVQAIRKDKHMSVVLYVTCISKWRFPRIVCSSLVDSLYYRLLNRRVSAFKTIEIRGRSIFSSTDREKCVKIILTFSEKTKMYDT